jgi:hypothetical protein
MLKIKKGLANILENHDNNNEPEETLPQPSQTPNTYRRRLPSPRPPRLGRWAIRSGGRNI